VRAYIQKQYAVVIAWSKKPRIAKTTSQTQNVEMAFSWLGRHVEPMRYEKPVRDRTATKKPIGKNVPTVMLPSMNLRPGATSYTMRRKSQSERRKTQITQPRPPNVTSEPVHAQELLSCMSEGVMAS
jgi:hypothetical protein